MERDKRSGLARPRLRGHDARPASLPEDLPQIELKPFDRAHIVQLIGWVRGPEELFDWAGATFSHPLDEVQLERHLAESDGEEEPYRVPFEAVRPGAAEPLAYVELCQVEPSHGSATICRILVAPGARGLGVGAAATTAALARGFDALGLHRIDLRVFQTNRAAVRLYERLGFETEGVMREARRDHAGNYRSYQVMSMLESEWRERPGAPAPGR